MSCEFFAAALYDVTGRKMGETLISVMHTSGFYIAATLGSKGIRNVKREICRG